MKNTIFFDSDFNFTLLENEENPDNSIYIKFHTSDAANQVLNILANGQTITESLASDDDIEYELEQTNWTDNGATAVWLTNDDITSPKVKIIFAKIPTVSCAINRGTNTVFLMQYEGQAEEESGSGSGGGSGSGSGFDFVETIRNIGFRLLDEPSDVSAEYDENNNQIAIKWTDPADIATNEPIPATWAGTVVVKKSGSAPLHKWDGTILVDSTTRDEYSVNALIDNAIEDYATYYYGIFPYFVAIDDANNPIKYYRYTKIIEISTTPGAPLQIAEFDYTGDVQEFIAPTAGTYTLEVWGAQGGGVDKVDNCGSYGGYACGSIDLAEGEILYICVGGQGGNPGTGNNNGVGGYNGGGDGGKAYQASYNAGGGGGGATHIATTTNRGELKNYSNDRNELVIVAGGGAGCSDWWDLAVQVGFFDRFYVGSGGGYAGSHGQIYSENVEPQGGTQTEGYQFGQGQAGANGTAYAGDGEGDTGAGGGYYGGRTNNKTYYKNSLGSGGSGYIGNSRLYDKQMAGFEVLASSEEDKKTISVNTHSGTPSANTPKEGNGYAKISWHGAPLPPAPQTALYEWDFTESLIDKVQGEEITLTNATRDANGIYFDYQNDVANIPTNLLQVGRKYEIYFGAFNISDPSVGNRRMFSFGSSYAEGFHYRGTSGKWATWDTVNYWQESGISARDYFENSVLTIEITADSKWHFYKDGTLFFEPSQAIALNQNTFALGAGQYGAYFMTITAFKIYELTE